MSNDWFNTGYEDVKKETEKTFTAEFRIKENEVMPNAQPGTMDASGVRMRFLDEQPITFRQHSFQIVGKYPKFTCIGDECPMCQTMDDNPRFVGAFSVYDYRDGKVKAYVQGVRVMKTLDRLHMMEGGLTGHDFVVMRQGTGTDTTYNFIPCPPTDFPAGAKNPDGSLKKINLIQEYKPLSKEALTSEAYKLSGGTVPPMGQQNPQPQQNQQGEQTFNRGVNF